MNNRHTTLTRALLVVASAGALVVSGCAKKEPAPSAPATPPPAAPAAAAPAPATPTAPAAPKSDSLTSMVSSATKAAESKAAQVNDVAATQPPAAPTTSAASSASAGMSSSLTALQGETKTTGDSTAATLASSAGAIQKQAEDLLARYSGELATLKTGALSVKNYVDQHPEILPEAAKAKYQQLNAMVPQLESLVGTLKDYKSVDLTTLVPKLQNDFTKAKSLYSEVRALLPATL